VKYKGDEFLDLLRLKYRRAFIPKMVVEIYERSPLIKKLFENNKEKYPTPEERRMKYVKALCESGAGPDEIEWMMRISKWRAKSWHRKMRS
jgi:hypothetical protein